MQRPTSNFPAGNAGQPAAGPSGPQVWILLLALVVPLLTIPGLYVDNIAVHIAGWVVAIGGSIGLLAAFTVTDLRRRSSRWYVDQPGLLAALRLAILVVGLVIAGLYAYRIADAIARLDWWFQ